MAVVLPFSTIHCSFHIFLIYGCLQSLQCSVATPRWSSVERVKHHFASPSIKILLDLSASELVQELLHLPGPCPVVNTTVEAALVLVRLDEVVQSAVASAEH